MTKRCVFKPVREGLALVECAPGIDVNRDILTHMEFPPVVRNPGLMDWRIFP